MCYLLCILRIKLDKALRLCYNMMLTTIWGGELEQWTVTQQREDRVCPVHKDIRWLYSHCWSHLISPSIHHQLAMASMRLQLKLLIASNSSMLLDHSWHLTLSRETSRNIQGRHCELTWWGEKRRERDGGKGEKRKRKRREEEKEGREKRERGGKKEEKKRGGKGEKKRRKKRIEISPVLHSLTV